MALKFYADKIKRQLRMHEYYNIILYIDNDGLSIIISLLYTIHDNISKVKHL